MYIYLWQPLIQFIRDIFATAQVTRRPVVSFEFFPTKTEDGERALLEKTIPALRRLGPDFCSVTYGAGGGTREKTLAIVDRIQREQQITAMAHLTCVNATIDETCAVLEQTRALGIKNVLALRGDPPNGSAEFVKTEGGFEYSYELVRHIREFGAFSIGVAGFPEGHIACREGRHVDWQRLKAKIDDGADFVITQLFFDNRHYFECRDFLAAQGVTVPIVPGILPILSTSQIKRFVGVVRRGAAGRAAVGAGPARRRRRGGDAVRNRVRDQAVRGAPARGRAGAAFLHAQQGAIRRPPS